MTLRGGDRDHQDALGGGPAADGRALITTRPFRAPHHTISDAGLIGGGSIPRPGEVSLAHHGVLFLDELPEFRKNVLEVLRQPLEDARITISRAMGTLTFPARSMLVAAMNPCPCGFYGDPQHECSCSPIAIQRYRSRISGPLLDRIDIHIEVPAVKYKDLTDRAARESSMAIRERVNRARESQLARFRGMPYFCNAQMRASDLSSALPDRVGRRAAARARDQPSRAECARLHAHPESLAHDCRSRRRERNRRASCERGDTV